ncbi:hypothetical protein BX600DRAFT_431285 [Xylariales sp. PMI_506]|nr:hypothetical protein BX600DRAFT_431285 [Xylariales sp. PMI_506]
MNDNTARGVDNCEEGNDSPGNSFPEVIENVDKASTEILRNKPYRRHPLVDVVNLVNRRDCLMIAPRDVLNLACMSKEFYRTLEMELYTLDVLRTRRQHYCELLSTYKLAMPNTEVDPNRILHSKIADIEDGKTRLQVFNLQPDSATAPTALHFAAISHNNYAAKRAVRAAALYWPSYIDAKCIGFTALLLAVQHNSIEVARTLVENGCFVDAWSRELDGVRKFVRNGCEFIKGQKLGREMFRRGAGLRYTPLGTSIALRYREMAQLLAENTRDGGFLPRTGDPGMLFMPSLHLACFAAMPVVVKSLLARGYDSRLTAPIFNDAEPLHLAAAGVDNNVIVLQTLIDHGACDLAFTTPGRRPLDLALRYKCRQNALYLLQNQRLRGELSGLTREAIECIESDDLLVVLQYILRQDKSPDLYSALRNHCDRLMLENKGVPTRTLRHLRSEGIVESYREQMERLAKELPQPRVIDLS